MACLNRYDIIAYPGSRFSTTFTAPDVTTLMLNLKDALLQCKWSAIPIAVGSEFGWECTNLPVPYCGPEFFDAVNPARNGKDGRPAAFIGQVVIRFYTLGGSTSNLIQFDARNVANDMPHSVPQWISLRTTTGPHAPYSYFFSGNAFDFTVFMLGVEHRVEGGITNQGTAVMAGVPQIPGFLSAHKLIDYDIDLDEKQAIEHMLDDPPWVDPDSDATDLPQWCKYGINEMFYCVQIDAFRTGGLDTAGNGPAVCGVRWETITRTHQGEGEDNHTVWVISQSWKVNTSFSAGFFFTFGVGHTQPGSDIRSGMWTREDYRDEGDDPDTWSGLMYPPLMAWQTDAADGNTWAWKGFGWDKVIVNKELPADDKYSMDGHEFIAVNNMFRGSTVGHLTPPATLLICIGGPV